MSDTPISDAATWKGEYGDDYSPDVVPLEVCRKMERENALLREALAKISEGHKRPRIIAKLAIAKAKHCKPLSPRDLGINWK